MRALVLLLTSLALSPVLAGAQVVTLNPDRDNTLFESMDGSLSNGAGVGVFAGANGAGLLRRALVRFPVAANVPVGTQVVSAVLRLHASQGQFQPQPFTAHLVQQSWGEGASDATLMGGGAGAPSEPGDATWLHTSFATSTWTNVGGDFDVSELASASSGALGWAEFGPTAALTQAVRDWTTGFAINDGFMIRGLEAGVATAVRFDSREHFDANVHPQLVLTLAPLAEVGGVLRGPLALRAAGASPFRDAARLELQLARESQVDVEVFDVRGSRMRTLLSEPLGAGTHALTWDGRDTAGRACGPGVYLARATSREGGVTARLVRVR